MNNYCTDCKHLAFLEIDNERFSYCKNQRKTLTELCGTAIKTINCKLLNLCERKDIKMSITAEKIEQINYSLQRLKNLDLKNTAYVLDRIKRQSKGYEAKLYSIKIEPYRGHNEEFYFEVESIAKVAELLTELTIKEIAKHKQILKDNDCLID
jgi:hypothetical protein